MLFFSQKLTYGHDKWCLDSTLIKNYSKCFIFDKNACIFQEVPILDFALSVENFKEQIPPFKGHPVFLAVSGCL